MPAWMWTAVLAPAERAGVHGAFGVADPTRGESRTLCLWDLPPPPPARWDRRGVRSATWHGGHLWLLLDDVLVQLDADLNLVGVHRHPLLVDGRRVRGRGGLVLVVGRALDVVLAFEPASRRWPWAMQIRRGAEGPVAVPVDPATELPARSAGLGLDQVLVDGPRLWVSGTGLGALLCIQGGRVVGRRPVPRGASDALPWGDGALFCRSDAGRVGWNGPRKGHLWLPDAAETLPARPGAFDWRSPGGLWPVDGGFVCGAWPGVLQVAAGEPPAWVARVVVGEHAWITDIQPWPAHVAAQPPFQASNRYLPG